MTVKWYLAVTSCVASRATVIGSLTAWKRTMGEARKQLKNALLDTRFVRHSSAVSAKHRPAVYTLLSKIKILLLFFVLVYFYFVHFLICLLFLFFFPPFFCIYTLYLLKNVKPGYEPHPASYPVDTGALSRGKSGRCVKLNTSISVQTSIMSGIIIPLYIGLYVDQDSLIVYF